jgi:LacI family transcriptional regulator
LKNKEINSVEIAKRAGVSRSTVSRVINNYSNVPPETREKVMKVIQQYNYFPNVSAQVLAGKITKTIGLFLIEKGEVASDVLTNTLVVSVIENASAAGYYVLTNIIRNTQDEEAVKGVKEIFYQRRINGGVFIGAASYEPLIEELAQEGFVVAVVDQELPDRNELNRIVVNFDNELGMQQAVDYLVSLNHQEIGVINGDMLRQSGPSKYDGYVKAMKKHGLNIHPEWVLSGDFNENSGYQAAKRLIDSGRSRPTAIIAANDSAAFGAMKAFKENGIQVPEDISVIGFDDHPISSMYHPALTTIKVDFKEMMNELTSALIRHIEQGIDEFQSFRIGCSLVIRDSCKAVL